MPKLLGIYFHLPLGVFTDESKSFRNVGTFEFKGENTESLLLGLRNELSAKEHFDAYSLDDTITVSSDLYSEDGIASEVYLLCGGGN